MEHGYAENKKAVVLCGTTAGSSESFQLQSAVEEVAFVYVLKHIAKRYAGIAGYRV